MEELTDLTSGVTLFEDDIQGLYLVFHNWQFRTPLEKNMKPSEIILNMDVRSSVYGLAVGDDIANSADFIKQSNPTMDWNYNGVYVKLVMGDYKVTYMMDRMVIFNSGNYIAEQDYLENPRGKILQIRVEALGEC